METKKIALACFIGGVICGAVALLLAPAIWWLGMLAGFAGGYVSYEFREFRRAIPIAAQAASEAGVAIWWGIKESALRPHPFFYSGLTLGVLFWTIFYSTTDSGRAAFDREWETGRITVMVFFALPITSIVMGLVVNFLTSVGADTINFTTDPIRISEDRPLLTYRNFFGWFAKGIIVFVLLFARDIWVGMIRGLWDGTSFVFRFSWFMFKLIHSEKRVLCGVDGALGGALSYIWFAATANPVLVVLFGGLLGAAFGILNWEIVSKRILKVANDTA